MKRMLINATQEEELRMAMVDGQRLYDLNIEAPASERKKANIYKGKITRIEPSLEAAFVDYGSERHGFLPLKEISSEYFVKNANGSGKPNIKDVLKEGQDIVVQVDKEERGNKGAALTTFVSLAGRFIVLKPNKAKSGGVSRRITGADRELARKALNGVQIPDGMSVILRTAGIDRTAEELAWDLDNLLTVWTAILNVVLERPSPFLIYRESDSVVRALRDYLTNDVGEILIDDEKTYKDACEHVESTMPHNLKKLKHYTDPVPLFTRFQIESQIESAFAHDVNLPSGGSIVIDHTEALVSIDINSARATKGGDIEATALNTNLEAADEIARQLRIRDLGGLIVIDFIDMGPQKHQREVENRLREAVRQDRARVQFGKISRFGLLEMSRQRLRPSIGESAYQTCPRCTGFGTIRGTESLALAILRIVGEEARKERTAKVIAQLPVEVATYLLNEKRDWVQNLEDQNDTQVVLVANSHMETPHYDVRRVRDDQIDLPENAGVSYSLADAPPEPESPQAILERKGAEAAAISTLKPSTPAPKREQPEKQPEKPSKKGLVAKILDWVGAGDEGEDEPAKPSGRSKSSGRGRSRSQQQKTRRRSDSRKSGDKHGQRKQTPKKAAQKKAPNRKKAAEKKPRQPQQKSARKPQNEEAKTEQKRSRRRSRGGRRRRRTADKPEQVNEKRQPETQKQDAAAKKPAAPKSERKPPAKDTAPKGPPKARTDAERAADAAKRADGTSQKSAAKPTAETKAREPKPRVRPKSEQASKPETKPASKPAAKKTEPKPASKPAAKKTDAKPESKPAPKKPAAKKTEPKPASKAEAKPAPKKSETKPEPKPAPKKTEAKPQAEKPAGRLLPWEPRDGGGQDSPPQD